MTLDDLPKPSITNIGLIRDDPAEGKVFLALERLGWLWVTNELPSMRDLDPQMNGILLSFDDDIRLYAVRVEQHPTYRFHRISDLVSGTSKAAEMCPECAVAMEFLALAYKCPKCFLVKG